MGEELFSVKLQLVFCDRGSWFHCVCGVATGRDRRGVCSGDSGGPVLYRGVQVRTHGATCAAAAGACVCSACLLRVRRGDGAGARSARLVLWRLSGRSAR